MAPRMLGGMSDAPDFFDNLYTQTLAALGDPALRGDDQARVAQLLVYLLDEWPNRWNERVERELATWALDHLADTQAVLALAEAFLGRRLRHPSSARILNAIVQRAARDDHAQVLVSVTDWMCNLDALASHLDDALVRQAVAAARVRGDERVVVSILGGWLSRHADAVAWIKPILGEHRWMASHLSGDMALFAAAPSAEAALAWAEIVDYPDLDALVDWRRLCAEPAVLQAAIRAALDRQPEREVQVVLRCWLHQVSNT